MKTILLFIALALFYLSCKSKKVEVDTPSIEEQAFDSSLVHPLSDSVASLYRTP